MGPFKEADSILAQTCRLFLWAYNDGILGVINYASSGVGYIVALPAIGGSSDADYCYTGKDWMRVLGWFILARFYAPKRVSS